MDRYFKMAGFVACQSRQVQVASGQPRSRHQPGREARARLGIRRQPLVAGIGCQDTLRPSDGTQWTWGRNAQVYTKFQNPALEVTPTRVGTNSDWAFVPACGQGRCQGLTKKDGFKFANHLGFKVRPPDAGPVMRQTPWRLTHVEADGPPQEPRTQGV